MKWLFEEILLLVIVIGTVSSNRGNRGARLPQRALAGRKKGGEENDRTVNYEHFDDYLVSIASSQSAFNSVLTKESSSTENGTSSTVVPTTPAPDIHPLDILNYFKDVPRQHWSCCMLGKLAGDKGFHCLADFYASRVQSRNFNRAHNRRMSFHTQDHMTSSPRAIMRTFQRCVARHASEFHKCCYAATVERTEMSRWQRFRAHAERSDIRVELEN